MFDRLISLIGEENFKKIQSTKILVLGIGGVGGIVAESLVRSGIEDITIIDKDVVDETNLNRQIIALRSTIGRLKVEVMKERLKDINPDAQIVTFSNEITTDSLEKMNLSSYDYVVDCIDDLRVKVALAKHYFSNDYKLLIATGTARKMDPSLLEITTLDKTSYDPLARRMRAALRGYEISKLIVLASKEVPIESKENTSSLGSTAFVPSSGGLLLASYIIRDIIK